MLVALGLGIISGRQVRQRSRTLWWMLMVLSFACVMLMVPVTSVLWTYVPKLRFVQFPWRWLFPLAVPMAAFVATAIARVGSAGRIILWTGAFGALALCGWLLERGTWWDSDGVADLQAAILERGTGYEGDGRIHAARIRQLRHR